MLRRVSKNLTPFLFVSDIMLTLLALYVAKLLRLTLPYGIGPVPAKYLEFPDILYPLDESHTLVGVR